MDWLISLDHFDICKIGGQITEEKRIVCFYGTWAKWRDAPMNYTADNIPTDLCTDVVYSFVGIDRHTWGIEFLHDDESEKGKNQSKERYWQGGLKNSENLHSCERVILMN